MPWSGPSTATTTSNRVGARAVARGHGRARSDSDVRRSLVGMTTVRSGDVMSGAESGAGANRVHRRPTEGRPRVRRTARREARYAEGPARHQRHSGRGARGRPGPGAGCAAAREAAHGGSMRPPAGIHPTHGSQAAHGSTLRRRRCVALLSVSRSSAPWTAGVYASSAPPGRRRYGTLRASIRENISWSPPDRVGVPPSSASSNSPAARGVERRSADVRARAHLAHREGVRFRCAEHAPSNPRPNGE